MERTTTRKSSLLQNIRQLFDVHKLLQAVKSQTYLGGPRFMAMKSVTQTKENQSRQALRMYLKEISKIPLLLPEEEKDLGRRIQEGDDEALERLVESNLRFVVKVAKRYRRFGVSFLDLINEGNLGLIEAAKRFDPNRNVKFISYAVWWIRQSILAVLSNLGRPLRLPIKINAALYKVGISMANRQNELNHKPSLEEIADDVGITRDELVSILKVGGEGISLSQPLTGEREGTLEDFLVQTRIPSAEQEAVKGSVKKRFMKFLANWVNVKRRFCDCDTDLMMTAL